ncbi:uncharacterized protein B0H18DRAFT_1218373 [Fomitopsis serialis]|uniref:uncharacterized protein n=1 Tax=Fomitopsis serialis TaxID=139415 RepID=UPI002008A6E4|nr:uncharacterized protein B0H18DRAFT_1218373 [Neoantrodia serialis]KAH9911298.1 hypothetical protein B0H18DRAFT_1218373 [Neoantrodia serialis]
MSFSPAAPRPRLQTEFYEFLEQKLLNVESQLSASEKERDALGVALTQAEKKLEASNVELNELRTNAAASIEALSNKDEVAHSTALLRQDLQRVSDLLARERARREEAVSFAVYLSLVGNAKGYHEERVTSETEAKVKTLVDKLAQCNSANEELKKKCSQESATQLTKITRLEATTKDMEKENTRLREEVVNKEKICSRAVAERAEAIAAETECRRQSNYVKSELDAVKKVIFCRTHRLLTLIIFQEISSLRTALNSITASTSDQLDLHSSAVKLRGFVDDLRALPAPAVAIDLAALTPVEIPASQHVSEILSGLRRRGVLTGFEMTLSDNLLWLPNSNHAITKWWRYTRCIKSKETREIFHTSHGKLYYVGTYQRVELGLDNIQLEAIDIKLFQVSKAALGIDTHSITCHTLMMFAAT